MSNICYLIFFGFLAKIVNGLTLVIFSQKHYIVHVVLGISFLIQVTVIIKRRDIKEGILFCM